MARDSLGKVDCPVCGVKADVRASKNGLAYIFCDAGCNLQIFTRQKHQHDKLMARLGVGEKSEPAARVEVKKIGVLLDD